MKRVSIICLSLLITILATPLSAQELSKAAERQLLEELKGLRKDPAKLKRMQREDKDLANDIKQQQMFYERQYQNRENLLDDLGKKDSTIFYLRDLVIKKENQNRTLTSSRDTTSLVSRPNLDNAKAYFRVQIGAYRNRKLAKSLQTNYKFITEQGSDGLKKYMIGDFLSYEEAKSLTKYLTRQGAQAFVVGYLDNKRLSTLRQMPKEYL